MNVDSHTPESISQRLAIHKMVTNGLIDGDFSPEIGMAVKSRKPVKFVSDMDNSQKFTTASRYTSGAHRSSSYRSVHQHHHHYEEEDAELQEKAENQLSSLLAFISNSAREASNLREYFSQVSSRKESWYTEREEYFRQIEELSGRIRRNEDEKSRHGIEVNELKDRVQKLLNELSTTLADATSEKKRVTEREQDIVRLQRELRESEERHTTRDTEFKRMKYELEKSQELSKKLAADSRHHQDSAGQLHRDLQRVTREKTDLGNQVSDLNNKHEHIKRELNSVKERFREAERERDESAGELSRVREENRRLVTDRDNHRDQTEDHKRKEEEARRGLVDLEENLRKIESSLLSSQSDVTKLTERVKHVERERDTAIHNSTHLITDINELRDKVNVLQAEVRTLSDSRSKVRIELDRLRQEYDDYRQHGVGFIDDEECSIVDIDNERLRQMLRDVRLEKDRAVQARVNADRERDEANNRLEKRSREWERWEEKRRISGGGRYHTQRYSSNVTSNANVQDTEVTTPARVVSQTETVLNHGLDGDTVVENGLKQAM